MTTAPSMPTKTQTVVYTVERTCSISEKPLPWPVILPVRMFQSKAPENMIVPIMTAMGMILAMTTIVLMEMASLTPPMTRSPNPQIMADPAIRETRFVPLPNMGKKLPRESKNNVMRERLPSRALSQKPHAELKPIYSPKPFFA